MAGNRISAKVGILALQGAVEPHARMLQAVGAEVVRVRKPEHLTGLSGIILPGGESTTFLHLLKINSLWEPLREFVQTKPVWGVCAGAILLAHKVNHPEQESLDVMDLEISRNAFGRQKESFSASLTPSPHWSGGAIEGVFIRAPRFTSLGANVEVLFSHEGEPVMVREGKKLASSFHPELTDSLVVHHYFVTQCEQESTPWTIDSPNTFVSSSAN